MISDFAVMIISHKRPECSTYQILRDSGYTGKIIIVVDDKDPTINDYILRYGKETIHIFTKTYYPDEDAFDNFSEPNSVAFFARNECFRYAKQNELKYILMIDDDLKGLCYRYVKDNQFKREKIKDFDLALNDVLDLFKTNDKLCCVGLSQGTGLFQGMYSPVRKEAYNAFIIDVDKTIFFDSRFVDDLVYNLQTHYKCYIILSVNFIVVDFNIYVNTSFTNNQSGGCVDIYRQTNAYIMNFYPILVSPSTLYIEYGANGNDPNSRQGVLIKRRRNTNTSPCIVKEEFKK